MVGIVPYVANLTSQMSRWALSNLLPYQSVTFRPLTLLTSDLSGMIKKHNLISRHISPRIKDPVCISWISEAVTKVGISHWN